MAALRKLLGDGISGTRYLAAQAVMSRTLNALPHMMDWP